MLEIFKTEKVRKVKNEAIKRIEEQQAKLKEGSPAWMVGEQLKDICRNEPKSAELIAQDLTVAEMSLEKAEKKIKNWADGHKTGNFACVTPKKADEILRGFYGLPAAGECVEAKAETAPVAEVGGMVDLADFL